MEVELDTNLLIDQGQRLKEGREHAFDAVIEGLVNNVHILCREVGGVLGA